MEHIINIAFELDDDAIRKAAEKSVEKEADKIIKEIFLDQLAPYGYGYFSKEKERDWDRFNRRIENAVVTFFDDKKEEIIDVAATKLVESLKRTKAWKEKYGEVIGSEP